jgi:hypothetical protein
MLHDRIQIIKKKKNCYICTLLSEYLLTTDTIMIIAVLIFVSE